MIFTNWKKILPYENPKTLFSECLAINLFN